MTDDRKSEEQDVMDIVAEQQSHLTKRFPPRAPSESAKGQTVTLPGTVCVHSVVVALDELNEMETSTTIPGRPTSAQAVEVLRRAVRDLIPFIRKNTYHITIQKDDAEAARAEGLDIAYSALRATNEVHEARTLLLTSEQWDKVISALWFKHDEYCSSDPERAEFQAFIDSIETQLRKK